jgi:hypothetical protein
MKAGDTRTFMALMAIVQHHGRPHTPTDQAPIESDAARRNSPGLLGGFQASWLHLR